MVPPLALDDELLQFRYEEVVVLGMKAGCVFVVEVQSINVYMSVQRQMGCDADAGKAQCQHNAHRQKCGTHHGRWCGSVFGGVVGLESVVVTRSTADEARG
jgi:hypothetical protein